MTARWLRRILYARFAVLAVRSFLPLGDPDRWRQTDTFAVSLRYWMRWTVEPVGANPLLPVVLASGDTQGIVPMEFPFLNWITAPFFAFGPSLGRSFSYLFLNSLMIALTLWNARVWRETKVRGVSPQAVESAMLLLPLFSFAMPWAGRFMPDYLSMILVCLAVGLSWRQTRSAASGALATLGLLIKPTSIVVFLLYLAHEERFRKWRRDFPWVAVSTGVAFLYYTLGMQAIRAYREIDELYAVGMRPLSQTIRDLFTEPALLGNILFYRPFFPGGIYLILGYFTWRCIRERVNRFPLLLAIAAAQLAAIILLDGGHAYIHQYYFLGVGPACCLVAMQVWTETRSRLLRAALVIGLLVPLIEMSAMDLRALYRKPVDPRWLLDRQCAELRERHPEAPWGRGVPFRTTREDYPTLGLCFGERQGSRTAKWGFFWKDAPIPAECRAIDETVNLALARCE